MNNKSKLRDIYSLRRISYFLHLIFKLSDTSMITGMV